MILHLCVLDKFIEPFYRFVKENFDDFDSKHQFYINGTSDKYKIPSGGNVLIAHSAQPLARYIRLVREMNRAKIIILHGLWDMRVLKLLCMQPWLLKKCCWVIWGGDLYTHKYSKKTWRWGLKELFRGFAIKRFRLITTTVPGDYDLVSEWYGTRARFVQNLMYTSHVCREGAEPTSQDQGQVIQIGNSADPSNNHIEIIDRIHRLNTSENIKFVAPLSYGDEAWANKVTRYGKRTLGNRFESLSEYMSFQEYNEYLKTVRVVLLNHNRQQAMGNTIALLSLGKKVYLRSDVTPWKFFNDLGLKVFDILEEIDISPLNLSDRKKNIEVCRTYFTESNLKKSWEKIFND